MELKIAEYPACQTKLDEKYRIVIIQKTEVIAVDLPDRAKLLPPQKGDHIVVPVPMYGWRMVDGRPVYDKTPGWLYVGEADSLYTDPNGVEAISTLPRKPSMGWGLYPLEIAYAATAEDIKTPEEYDAYMREELSACERRGDKLEEFLARGQAHADEDL